MSVETINGHQVTLRQRIDAGKHSELLRAKARLREVTTPRHDAEVERLLAFDA